MSHIDIKTDLLEFTKNKLIRGAHAQMLSKTFCQKASVFL